MDHFNYRHDELYAEEVPVADIIAQYGTPCYVYSRATIERHWRLIDEVCGKWPHRICYAVKANDNLAILDLLARLGSGFDIVSQGELERLLYIGVDPKRIVFSGVAKSESEINRALSVQIGCFNVESEAELMQIQQCAHKQNKVAPIALRINPNVDAKTHPYIATGLRDSKFGIEAAFAEKLYLQAKLLSHIEIKGIDCHIGSQLTSLEPFKQALNFVLDFVDKMKGLGIFFKHIDMGGGLGVPYHREDSLPTPADYTASLLELLKGRPLELILEPGRLIMANAGILLSRVEYIKSSSVKQFAIIDAGMNDLLRPALYQASHEIIEVKKRQGAAAQYEVVGPVCESSDRFGEYSLGIQSGDYLAIRTAGAYGASMASRYNARRRACEVMVEGGTMHLIRERETWEDLFSHEHRINPS
ncbi:MAG: lysA [Gammaproteobacteria bacterium]|jgi:diaminopimelate decarboxylase|nr:lysA [Gammaproteobacteria bacterium]